MSDDMIIYINGQAQQTHADYLSTLIDELGLTGKRIAVEIDGQLIAKSRHASTRLYEQARIEIIVAVGGG